MPRVRGGADLADRVSVFLPDQPLCTRSLIFLATFVLATGQERRRVWILDPRRGAQLVHVALVTALARHGLDVFLGASVVIAAVIPDDLAQGLIHR